MKMKTLTTSSTIDAPESPQSAAVALDTAVAAVTGDLPKSQQQTVKEKAWGDRPENLRKSLGEMSDDEKRQYYLYKAREFSGEKPEGEKARTDVYTPVEMEVLGVVVLGFLAERLPVKKPATPQEIKSFGVVFTPLANKYLGATEYKDELAAAVFMVGFFFARRNPEKPGAVGHE